MYTRLTINNINPDSGPEVVKAGNIPSFAAVVLLMMIITPAFFVSSAETEMSDKSRDVGTWLFLIYMAGDNSLGANGTYGNAAWMDLEELESNHPTDNVEVIVLSDMKDDHNTHLYRIKHHPIPGIGSEDIPLSNIDPSWGDELDMSNWRVLRDFLNYSLSTYTADNVMLTIWDHGSGWYRTELGDPSPPQRGFAYDTGGSMRLDGLRQAFEEASGSLGEDIDLDIISFDTCSMGSVEVFEQVSRWARIGIGSEDEQPWYGYNYTFVGRMGGADPLGPVDLTRELVRMFKETYGPTETYSTIISADLTIMTEHLIPSWDNLSREIFEWTYYLEVVKPHLLRAALNRAERMRSSSYSDMGDLLAELIYADLTPTITDLANVSLNYYNSMIIDEYHHTGENPAATGLSIYLPMSSSSYNTMYDGIISFLNFTIRTYWDEALREFYGPLERVSISFNKSVMDGDGLENDLIITVTAPEEGDGVRIGGADVYVDGGSVGPTDEHGNLTIKDFDPGVYEVIAYNGTHVGVSSVKMMNRPPFASCEPTSLNISQGEQATLYALGSYDPDGDPMTYGWDLDDSDGLDDTDSSDFMVVVSFEEVGTRVVRLTVSDGEEANHVDIPIRINNVIPTAVLTIPTSTYEDQIFNVSGWGSSDRTTETEGLFYHYTIDGDGSRDWTNEPNMTLSFETAGIHRVTIRVRDGDDGLGEATDSMMVFNTLPVANMSVPATVSEDDPFTLDGSTSTDTSSDLPTLNYTWMISGDTVPKYGPMIDMSISDEGIYSISLEVTDDDGDASKISRNISVLNVAPTAIINGPSTGVEDEVLRFDGSSSVDTVSDIPGLVFSWDTNDDSIPDMFGREISISLKDEGDHRITLWVVDDDGLRSEDHHWISIVNAPPTPSIAGDATGAEDELLEFYLEGSSDTASDMGSLVYLWSINGDEIGGGLSVLEHVFTMKGTYSIGVEVLDDQGASGYDEMEVTISNPPPVALLIGVPLEVTEGESFTALGYRSHDTPSDDPTLIFNWYLDGELLEEETGRNLTIEAKGVGKHTLSLQVVDDDGISTMSDECSFNVMEVDIGSRLSELLFSPLGIVMVMMLLALIFLSSYLLKRKTEKLPRPIRGDLEAEGEAQEGDQEGEAVIDPGDDSEKQEVADEPDIGYDPVDGPDIGPPDEVDLPAIDGSIDDLDMPPPEIADLEEIPMDEGIMEEPEIPEMSMDEEPII